MKKSNTPMPPIIDNMIEGMYNKSLNIYVRDNYRVMLENVRDQCTEAIQKFNLERYAASDKRQA